MLKWSNLIGLRIVAFTSIVVTSFFLVVRLMGLLQASELSAFDQMLRLRPYEALDSRLLVVTIDDADLAAQRRNGELLKGTSLSDQSLNRLLAKLEKYQPRAIGLDLYRDFHAEDRDIISRLQKTDNLIGICKGSDAVTDIHGIAPPPEIPKERLGFSDLIVDPDRVVRRHLLSMNQEATSLCSTPNAFSLQLASLYLAAQGIEPKYTTDGNLQFGNTVFHRLGSRASGYQSIDANGGQILVNYRSTKTIAEQVTLTQLLSSPLNASAVKDKIVLIGVVAKSYSLDFATPYGTELDKQMPGVMIQAHMVSQILSAVLDRRPLLWVLPWWGEILWIWGWSLVGGTIFWSLQPILRLGLAGGIVITTLYGICFFLLLIQGGWLPFVPSVLAFIFTEVGVLTVFIYICPVLSREISEDYRDRPAVAQQMINTLISSNNHNLQKVAAQAIARIAVNSLSHCQILDDIVAIGDELAWIPSPPPKELGSVLPQMLDITQGVRASVYATSPSRKSELLKFPISKLRSLKNSIAFTTDAYIAASFGSIAERWLRILETAQHTLEEQARYSQEIPQVYIAGNSLDPKQAKNRFKGRIDLFREIETLALCDQPPVLLLYGGRRTGKSSALKYLPYKVGANLVPLLVDLQGAASATTLRGLADNLATQIIEAARRLPRTLKLPYPDSVKLAQDPFPALQTWLLEIERTVPGKQFLLCMDEFERLSEVVEATGSRAPLNFIRNVLQHQHNWTLLFSGSHQLSELPNYWSDYLINTRALQVSYLDRESARELILQPVENFPNIYESDAVEAIIQLTRCQPYLVQLVCYELVELLNREIRENRREADTAQATLDDVNAVIPIVLERGDQYFRELWTSLTDSDRNLLRRLVQGETPTAQDKAVVRKLVRKEILENVGDRFQVPLIQKYVELVLEEE